MLSETNPSALVDNIANELVLPVAKKQRILEATPFVHRLEVLLAIVSEEIEIAAVEKELARKFKENVDKNQKDYFLKERMKVIQEELGEEENAIEEADEWLKKLDELRLE